MTDPVREFIYLAEHNFKLFKQNIEANLKKKNKTIIFPDLGLLSLLNRK